MALVGNRAIENAAIGWVMSLEAAAGRTPVDNRSNRTFPGDIASAPRIIEVKAFGRSTRGADLWLEVAQVEAGRTNRDFYLYVVENVAQGDPAQVTLRVLHGDRLAHVLARARERRYFEVPGRSRTMTRCRALRSSDQVVSTARLSSQVLRVCQWKLVRLLGQELDLSLIHI